LRAVVEAAEEAVGEEAVGAAVTEDRLTISQ